MLFRSENIFLLSFLNFYNEEIIKPKEIQIYKNELLINTFENIYLIENKNYQVFDKRIGVILSPVSSKIAKLTLVGPEVSEALKIKCFLVEKKKNEEEIPLDKGYNNEDLNILDCFHLSQYDYNITYNNEKMFHLKFIEGTKFSVWKYNDNVELVMNQ